MTKKFKVTGVEDYEQYVGADTIERLMQKARPLKDMHIVHVNSTYYGGGVAELLSSLTFLLNDLGIKTGWRIIFGPPDFFRITKGMHNALQGGDINLTGRTKEVYESIVYENSVRINLDHDFVIIHDPQPLPLIEHYRKKGPWVWRCHIDLSNPHRELWNYLKTFIEKYDAAIVSIKEYGREISIPQLFFMPAIDPFTMKNREISDETIDARLRQYDIPTDLPLVVQVSRFDRWKDPEGVIKAFQIARKEVDCTLVMLGNIATDDPEGQEVFESLLEYRDERIIIRSVEDAVLVNALQKRAAVVLQKSLREGFGLTVTEAMWKGTPVIGGNVGGIPSQIRDGVNGYLVSTIEEAAERIVQLLKDEDLRRRMGESARKTVRGSFLIVRLLEQYLDMLNSFEVTYRLT
ncbi:glycosyltransferase [Desulfoscipio sp. XC116]|uniref:glycosyltransferase n=1 Tax=Desulfoscipio sp. XC116 TaxID=3144975 RepID=UPI00325A65B6